MYFKLFLEAKTSISITILKIFENMFLMAHNFLGCYFGKLELWKIFSTAQFNKIKYFIIGGKIYRLPK